MKYLSPIRWTGSKRTQSERIISRFPDKIEKYVEPFVGGGSVFMHLVTDYQDMLAPNFKAIICDTNKDLIVLWKLIKKDPKKVIDFYNKYWNERNTINGIPYCNCIYVKDNNVINHRNDHYYKIREQYNKHYLEGTEEGACELMCLMATCFNGLVRYGKNGFNSPCMPVIPGMNPKSKEEIIMHCHEVLNKYDVDIRCWSYLDLDEEDLKDAVVYCDPPYKMFLNEKSKSSVGVYNSANFNLSDFSHWCNEDVDCRMLLISFDSGDIGWEYFASDKFEKVEHDTGVSNFRRQQTKMKDEKKKTKKTSESLYIRKY